jgi:hypothetical protein
MERKYIRVNRELTGVKNNLLTAINKLEKNKRWYWRCKCECGNFTEIREDFFISGKTKSCGCFGSRNSVYKINQKPPTESAKNSYYGWYKQQSNKRKIEFLLSKDEFLNIVSQNCFYCNEEPKESGYNKKSHGIYKCNGIDRVDSNLGYELNNVVPCCKKCNYAKNEFSELEFFKHIEQLYNNLKKKGFIK